MIPWLPSVASMKINGGRGLLLRLTSDTFPMSCEAAATVKPRTRLCEPWVTPAPSSVSREAATEIFARKIVSRDANDLRLLIC